MPVDWKHCQPIFHAFWYHQSSKIWSLCEVDDVLPNFTSKTSQTSSLWNRLGRWKFSNLCIRCLKCYWYLICDHKEHFISCFGTLYIKKLKNRLNQKIRKNPRHFKKKQQKTVTREGIEYEEKRCDSRGNRRLGVATPTKKTDKSSSFQKEIREPCDTKYTCCMNLFKTHVYL